MKFKVAIILSIIFHISIAALAIYGPNIKSASGTIYYVDLIDMPGGGPAGGKGSKSTSGQLVGSSNRLRNLTVKKEHQSKLRYPDKKSKKRSSKKKDNKSSLITVVKKDKDKIKPNEAPITTTRRNVGDGESDGLTTGISSGSGTGGVGSGYGDGTGTGLGSGYFPYAYYIQTLRNKISSSWYSSLVSPGLKGKYIVVVYFRIQRNGEISDLKLERKSQNNSLDLSSLRAVKDAAPFPPLPHDFPGQYLGVHFEFEWEK
jgi:protein TonB